MSSARPIQHLYTFQQHKKLKLCIEKTNSCNKKSSDKKRQQNNHKNILKNVKKNDLEILK